MDQRPQSQTSLQDQLVLLLSLANKAGLYDAADWISKVLSLYEKPII